jgi:hypothetical protein
LQLSSVEGFELVTSDEKQASVYRKEGIHTIECSRWRVTIAWRLWQQKYVDFRLIRRHLFGNACCLGALG